MNAFDDPIEETEMSISLARNSFNAWKAGDLEQVTALQRIGQATGNLEVARAIWMETARQGISRLSTRLERELLNFCELVKGIDNQKDYGVSLLEHVQRDALSSLEAGLTLADGQDREEAVSVVISSCANVLAIKSALLETRALKATIEANGETTAYVEELKKRLAVIATLLSRLNAAASKGN
jgi:hypothetical protein